MTMPWKYPRSGTQTRARQGKCQAGVLIGAPVLRFWINVRGGDKGALSPDRLVAYLPGNNLGGFGRTGTNLLKRGLKGTLPGQISSCVETSTKAKVTLHRTNMLGQWLKAVGCTSYNT